MLAIKEKAQGRPVDDRQKAAIIAASPVLAEDLSAEDRKRLEPLIADAKVKLQQRLAAAAKGAPVPPSAAAAGKEGAPVAASPSTPIAARTKAVKPIKSAKPSKGASPAKTSAKRPSGSDAAAGRVNSAAKAKKGAGVGETATVTKAAAKVKAPAVGATVATKRAVTRADPSNRAVLESKGKCAGVVAKSRAPGATRAVKAPVVATTPAIKQPLVRAEACKDSAPKAKASTSKAASGETAVSLAMKAARGVLPPKAAESTAGIKKEIALLRVDLSDLKSLRKYLETLAQRPVTMTVEGREIGRVVSNFLGKKFQKPMAGSSGFDSSRNAFRAGYSVVR